MALGPFQVNGSAICYLATYTNGVLGSFNLLGYTDHGVRIRVIQNYSDIITDAAGPMTPQDIQDMGMVANISCPFMVTDRAQLTSLQGRGDSGTTGQVNTPGLVLGASSFLFAIGIASSSVVTGVAADSPWMFPYCITRPGFDSQLATRANPFNMEFFAFPYFPYTTTTSKGTSLWQRTFTHS